MKNIQQEVLLVIDTRFSYSLWRESQSPLDELSSDFDYLESACWQGILSRSLPEIFSDTPKTKKFKIWQIKTCDHYLKLDFAESVCQKDMYHTIDPYLFIKWSNHN